MKRTIRDVDVRGKKVVLRVDFNVPVQEGKVADDTRIKEALPTIRYLLDNGARVIILSHLGRPKNREPEFSLKPVYEKLKEYIDKVSFVPDCVGDEVERKVQELKDGEAVLLENVRFYKEETKNDPEFARRLASLGEIYVNDAFATAHRAHASTHGIAGFMERKVAGFLMEKEIKYLSHVLKSDERPFTVILGGAKISTKLGVIKNLLSRADKILLGGAMIFTFFRSQGIEVGKSLVEEEMLDEARRILSDAGKKEITFILPVDVVVADKPEEGVKTEVVSKNEIPQDKMGLDIGPVTRRIFQEALKGSKVIFWNGPMGLFEVPPFDEGSKSIAQAIVEETKKGAISVAGGGDTAACIHKLGLSGFTHISTGGGASMEFIAGEKLPGIEVLEDA
ncbi:phosphoglycerate kinase [bacterium]|mgnify:CR=1 FL=1|nr:MAG: phosphoglycerate kinase [bacterium]RKZ26327.1 MAG: phosphoglycerate kinase [bacterium]